MLDQWHIAYGIAYQKLEIIHADTPTRPLFRFAARKLLVIVDGVAISEAP